jgi:hypothetical protein
MKCVRKFASIFASIALVSGTVAAALSLTTTAADASVYTHTDMVRCYWLGSVKTPTNACIELFANSTYSGSQVWINGKVQCYLYPSIEDGLSEQKLKWCGVGGGNGTATMNIGINWTDAFEGPSISYLYERIYIPASGSQSCKSGGSNLKYGTIYDWWNDYYVCNWKGAGAPQGPPSGTIYG